MVPISLQNMPYDEREPWWAVLKELQRRWVTPHPSRSRVMERYLYVFVARTFGETCGSIGAELGCSHERVRQMDVVVIRRLQKAYKRIKKGEM